MEAAQLIRTARVRRGLSQAQLASRARTSQPVISAYERGHRAPTIPTLRRLVAAAGDVLEIGLGPVAPALDPPADQKEHGERLVDVLLLADAIPHTPPPMRMPRIDSTR